MRKFTLRISALILFLAMGTFAMAQFNVTFNVDMTDVEGFDAATHSVYISGNIFDWPEPGTTPDTKMTATEENPMIYTITAELAEAGEIQYKFFSDFVAAGWAGGEWNGDPNRKIFAVGEGSITNAWADKPFPVLFSVDMTEVEGFDPETQDVYMAGTINMINNWQEPGSDPSLMMLAPSEKEMIYTLELSLTAGTYQYKNFTVETGTTSWTGGEWEGDPNREIVIDTLHAEFATIFGEKPAGINNPAEGPITSVFPNPCESFINVTFFENTNDINKVEVYNIIGEVIQTIEGISGQAVTINTADLTSGVYFVAVHNNKGIQTTKFVKQ
jgi:hypothetical protein